MKNHFRNYTFLIVITFIFTFFLGCQKEDLTLLEETTTIEESTSVNSSSSLIDKNDVPEVLKKLNQSIASSDIGSYTIEQILKTIDTDRILETKRSDETTLYTFSFRSQKITGFHNFIIPKDVHGMFQEPYILEVKPTTAYVEQYKKVLEEKLPFEAEKKKLMLHEFFSSLQPDYVSLVSNSSYPERTYKKEIRQKTTYSDVTDCTWRTTQNLCPLQPGTGTGVHTADECGEGVGTTWSIVITCPSGAPGNSDHINSVAYYETHNTTGGGGGGLGGGPGDDGVQEPIDEFYLFRTLNFLIESLDINVSQNAVFWLMENMDVVTMVKQIQLSHGNTSQFREIAQAVIDYAYVADNKPTSEDLLERVLDSMNSNDITVEEAIDVLEYVKGENTTDEAIEYANSIVYLAENLETYLPPSCKSFEYVQNLDNTQTAAVKNISMHIDYVTPDGIEHATDINFSQPLYFTIPRFHEVYGNLTTGNGKERSAEAIATAHSRAVAYFLATNATESQLRPKILEYIKDEFRNGTYLSGGVVDVVPPLNSPDLPINQYQTSTWFTDRCD